MPQETSAEAPATKPKKLIKIGDVKGRKEYGNPPPDGRVLWTHPTKQDIQKAIDDNYFIARPFSGNQEALMNEWVAASGGDAMKFIEVATRWHAGRIAHLYKEGNKDPIGIDRDYNIHDGLHRLLAAEFRGDTEIEAVIG